MLKIPAETALSHTESLAIQGIEETQVLIWQEPDTAAALGISQSAQRELNLETVNEDSVRIVRRQSGGGAVILNKNVLCIEVIAPLSDDIPNLTIRESFQNYTAPLVDLLKEYQLDTTVSGISDITVQLGNSSKKVAGCAQLRKKNAIVVHASILVDLDLSILEHYLQFPSDVPDYRQNRSHTDFCISLSELIPDLTPDRLSSELSRKVSEFGWQLITAIPELDPLGQELYAKKYSQTSWNIDKQRQKITLA